MHIILGEQHAEAVSDRYVVLELDTFRSGNQHDPVSAFCVIENVPIHELSEVATYRDLHQQLIKNYRTANWPFCEHALEHLQGRWNGEIDSFYKILSARVQEQKQQACDSAWDAAIRV